MADIVHFSFSDSGGAGGAALAYHRTLQQAGCDSLFCVRSKQSTETSIIVKPKHSRLVRKINKIKGWFYRASLDEKYPFYALSQSPSYRTVKWIRSCISDNTKVVVVHWVSELITLQDLSSALAGRDVKVFIFVMDMAPITGGCHYSYGCSGFVDGCLDCPGAKNLYFKKKIATRKRANAEAIQSMSASFVCFNRYTLDQVERSTISQYCRAFLVKPPIDQKIFDHHNKLVSDNPKVLIGAYNPSDKRKGFEFLRRALAELSLRVVIEKKCIELMLPEGVVIEGLNSECYKLVYYKFASNPEDLSKIYSQADLLVNTSLDDSGPLMISEAAYCGVPFVATNVGVVAELLEHDKGLGVSVNPSNEKMLAGALYQALFLEEGMLHRGQHIADSIRRYYEGFDDFPFVCASAFNAKNMTLG